MVTQRTALTGITTAKKRTEIGAAEQASGITIDDGTALAQHQ